MTAAAAAWQSPPPPPPGGLFTGLVMELAGAKGSEGGLNSEAAEIGIDVLREMRVRLIQSSRGAGGNAEEKKKSGSGKSESREEEERGGREEDEQEVNEEVCRRYGPSCELSCCSCSEARQFKFHIA